MHDGCSGHHTTGKEIVDKIRMMGFNTAPLAAPLQINCTHCTTMFAMTFMETPCPSCGMVYGVTPCSAHDPKAVKAAGVGY